MSILQHHAELTEKLIFTRKTKLPINRRKFFFDKMKNKFLIILTKKQYIWFSFKNIIVSQMNRFNWDGKHQNNNNCKNNNPWVATLLKKIYIYSMSILQHHDDLITSILSHFTSEHLLVTRQKQLDFFIGSISWFVRFFFQNLNVYSRKTCKIVLFRVLPIGSYDFFPSF